MKINRLQLTNFINHPETKINFDRVNVFVGPNGAGKTSILNGIEWALTGSCRGMAKKRDAAGVIMHGAKFAEAWLEFEKNGEGPAYYVDRRCTPSNTTLVFGQGEKVIARGLQEAQEQICEVLGITAEIANVLFDVFALPQLSNAERKKIVQSVMATEGTEALANYLEEKGFGNMPEDHLDAIISAYREQGLGSDTKGAYGYAVQMRRDYKRQLGEIPKPEPPIVGDDSLKGQSADDLKKAIEQAEAERDELLRVKAYDAGQVDSTKESIRLMEAEIAKVNGQIEAMGDVEGTLKEAAENFHRAEEAAEEITSKGTSDGGEIGQLQMIHHWLESMGDSVSQKSIKTVATLLKNAEKGTETDQSEDLSDLEERKMVAAVARRSVIAAQEVVAVANQLKAQNEQNNRILEGLKADLTNAESQKDTGLSPDQLAEKLGALEHGIGLYRTRLEQLTRYDEYLKSLEGIREREKALSARVANWDKLAEALNPKNPDLKILMGTTFGTFQELFRSASTALGVPSTVSDEDFSIKASPKGVELTVEWISDSEVYRVGIALEMALCAILGIRTAIIDKGETLFEDSKRALSGLVSAPSNYIDCFLLLATGGFNTKCSNCDDINDKQLPGDKCKACVQGTRESFGQPPKGFQLRGVKDGKVLDAS